MGKDLQWKHINNGFKEDVQADGKKHKKWKVTDEGNYYSVVFYGGGGIVYKGKFYKLPDGEHAVWLSESSNPLFFKIIVKKGGFMSSGGTYVKLLKGVKEGKVKGAAEGVAAIKAAQEAKASEGFKPKPIGVLRVTNKVDYYKRMYNV
jgi:hypothetical protein